MDKADKPIIRLGFNPVTGAREFIVIEPRPHGFRILKGSQLRAIGAAYHFAAFLNKGRP